MIVIMSAFPLKEFRVLILYLFSGHDRCLNQGFQKNISELDLIDSAGTEISVKIISVLAK